MKKGYESFVVPDDVGGRFSVLTAVGLLPIAVSGADIDQLMAGAAAARKRSLENAFEDNDALLYAAIRIFCLEKERVLKLLQVMSRLCCISVSGGNSCSVKAKVRMAEVYSLQALL